MSSVSGRDGRSTPLRATPTSEGEGSAGSNISDKVEALSHHVNSTDIGTVVQHIRWALQQRAGWLCSYLWGGGGGGEVVVAVCAVLVL